MTPLVCGSRTRVRTWRSSGSSPANADWRPRPKAGAVVGDDGDRSGNQVDDLAGGLVDARQLAAIVTQVVEAEEALRLDNSRV